MSVPYSRYVIGSIPWYGFLIALGVAVAILLASYEEKRLALKRDTVIDLAFWVIPLGLICARIYYVLFQWETFADNPVSVLYLWEGGIAIYGAVIGGLIAILLFSRRRRLNPFLLTDMIVPGLALAQCIGRWGNYFNMEAYGREISDPAWQFFPIGVQIPENGRYVWHMATFFYESGLNLLIFIVLWFFFRKKSKITGTVTLCYLLLYGIGRFMIEGLRTDSLMLGGIRVSQLLSLGLVILSVVLLIINASRQRKQP